MPKTERRVAFPAARLRAAKKSLGSTATLNTPVEIRTMHTRLDDETKGYVQRSLARKLGKFAQHIERISVRYEDVNGPKGGRDKVCRIQVALNGLAPVVVDERGDHFLDTYDLAVDNLQRAVRRHLDRAGRRSVSKARARDTVRVSS
ncbi:MAG TPA: HPF/RaiA family ribosome-associated protein [Polyangiaceae bacterium]